MMGLRGRDNGRGEWAAAQFTSIIKEFPSAFKGGLRKKTAGFRKHGNQLHDKRQAPKRDLPPVF